MNPINPHDEVEYGRILSAGVPLVKIKMLIVALSVAAASPTLATPAAGAGQWERVGSATLAIGRDRELIQIRNSVRIRRIRVCVATRAVRIESLSLGFLNGELQELPIRRRLGLRRCSLIFPVRHGEMRTALAKYAPFTSEPRPFLSVEAK
jgi:hypothetical protein